MTRHVQNKSQELVQCCVSWSYTSHISPCVPNNHNHHNHHTHHTHHTHFLEVARALRNLDIFLLAPCLSVLVRCLEAFL